MDPIEKIRELYEQNPDAKEDFMGRGDGRIYTWGLDHFLAELKRSPPADFSLKTLDGYQDDFHLAIVLAHLPAELICAELGDDALIWAAVKYPYSTQKKVLMDGLKRVLGWDPDMVEKARYSAWKLMHNEDASLVKAIYEVDKQVIGGIAQSLDMDGLLQENTKPGIELSIKRLHSYSVRPLITKGTDPYGYELNWGNNTINGNKRFRIYLDSPICLALTYNDEPNAIVGFYPCDLDTIMINQLQGVRPAKLGPDGNPIGRFSSRGLMPLEWQSLLVEVVGSIGKSMGYSTLKIQSGYNNVWTRNLHLKLKDAIKSYDDVAKRLGFSQGESKDWYKDLDNLNSNKLQPIPGLKPRGFSAASYPVEFKGLKISL